MESSESMNGHGSPTGIDGTSSDDLNSTQSSIRFLVSNAAAGSIIGKGGSNINELQSHSGARIQLSRNYEYFPGTTDRVVVLNGAISDILNALKLILERTLTETNENTDALKPNQVKLLLPSSVCGAIIGKGGSTIKALIEESQANIKLSSQDQGLQRSGDRIVMIMGDLEQQVKAATLILEKVSQDMNYMQYGSSPLSYGGSGILHVGPVVTGNAVQNKHGVMPPIFPLQAPYQVTPPLIEAWNYTTTISVPDEHIGVVVGRGGKTINEIQQASGVNVRISNRGDFFPGTNSRKVTLMGTAVGVQMAQRMVTQKVQQTIASAIGADK